jgi:hypothetical protein
MTHREFAVRIGASENMTERYIAGTALPTGDRLAALVKLTGISREQLEAGRYHPTARRHSR